MQRSQGVDLCAHLIVGVVCGMCESPIPQLASFPGPRASKSGFTRWGAWERGYTAAKLSTLSSLVAEDVPDHTKQLILQVQGKLVRKNEAVSRVPAAGSAYMYICTGTYAHVHQCMHFISARARPCPYPALP